MARTVSFYFNAKTGNWTTTPDNLIDGNINTDAETDGAGTVTSSSTLTANTCDDSVVYGVITKVEVVVYGTDTYKAASNGFFFQPKFGGSGGSNYQIVTNGEGYAYIDITHDGSAPATFTFTNIKNIDVLIYGKDNGSGKVKCSYVGLRVSYVPASVDANFYNIELRDKEENLKAYLTPFVSDVSWEWNRIGGCGSCNITIDKPYRDIEFDADDDIQIRIRSGITSKLVYRGYIETIIPSLQSSQQIKLTVKGYFNKLKKLIVHDNGETKEYENTEISLIVASIVDTFITTKTSITKGTIDVGVFTPDLINFRTTVHEALNTLAELNGEVEYGVDEDLVFFWRNKSKTIRHKFFIGNNVESFERRFDWSKLLNKIYFQGGDVDGVPFLQTAEALDSQTMFFLSEGIITNSSIVTQSVADQYLGATLKEKSNPVLVLRAKIPNTLLRLEDTLPIGELAFYDPDYDQFMKKWGTTANGGDNIIWGKSVNGGSNARWGSYFHDQVSSIKYTISETEERFNIDLLLGDSILETAARIKQVENQLSNLRARA
jgi:hypothetical protein